MFSDMDRNILRFIGSKERGVLYSEVEDAFPEDWEVLDHIERLRAYEMLRHTGTETGGYGRYLLTKTGRSYILDH